MFAFDTNKLLKLISDKSGLIKYLLTIIEKQQKKSVGLSKIRESLIRKDNPNISNANIVNCLEKTMLDSVETNESLMEISILLLVYTQSSGFDADVAKLLSKLGKGEEALRAMMDAKLKGK